MTTLSIIFSSSCLFLSRRPLDHITNQKRCYTYRFRCTHKEIRDNLEIGNSQFFSLLSICLNWY